MESWPSALPGKLQWRSAMVVTGKKNGTVRTTTDFQHLNSQCEREPHPSQAPFQLATQIPPNTFKTVLDAVDGYFSVPLENASSWLTCFITEWGTFRYLRAPQGFSSSGDAYTARYDEITKHVERLFKIIDDSLLFDYTIEESFWHVWDYLALCSKTVLY